MDTADLGPLYEVIRSKDTMAAHNMMEAGLLSGNLNALIQKTSHEDVAVEARKDSHVSLMHVAATNGDAGMLKLLIEHGADADTRAADSGRSPLVYAVVAGHFLAVKTLVEAGCDVNSRCVYDVTPLHEACRCGLVEIIEFLVDNGADVDAQDCGGVTPTMWLVSWLILMDIDVRIGLLKRFLSAGCNLDLCGVSEGTALHAAVWNSRLTEFLLHSGADPNILTSSGETCIISAVEQDNLGSMQLLVDHNCDVNVHKTMDILGIPLPRPFGALEKAARNGNHQAVRLLLRAGYRVTRQLFALLDAQLTGTESWESPDHGLRATLYECLRTPQRLDWLARFSIRTYLGRNLKNAEHLPLPKSLIGFVKYT